MSWLEQAVKERRVISPTHFKEVGCFHCEVPVTWDTDDKRASDEGSFVAEDGSFTCPTGHLHQG